MKKTKLILIVFLMSVSMVGCTDNKGTTDSSSTESTKEVIKNKTKESITSSSFKDVEAEKTIESKSVEANQEVPVQPVSDMPPSWYGTAEEWEEAKLQGWTVEGYEEQVRASENESGPIQPGDSNYVWPYELDDQRNDFFNEFYSEHGREPSSGEIQAAWAKEQGWE